jgi:hypothetical protein
MSTDTNNLLHAFDALAPAEQQLVAIEILRRSVSLDEIADDTFDGLASEVFQRYDAEESSSGGS